MERVAEFLTCPWCGKTLKVQQMQENGVHGVKHMERIDKSERVEVIVLWPF